MDLVRRARDWHGRAFFQKAGAALDAGPLSSPVAPPGTEVPATDVPMFSVEPGPVHGILGREKKVAEIGAMLARTDVTSEAAPTLVLRGMGGIGKTTLAIAVARDAAIARRFPDGVAWTALSPYPNVRSSLH